MSGYEPWIERILRVADHVQAHLEEELDPAQLAALAGFSQHHFHRVFRGMTGESVMGFIRRLRLERAAARLKFGSRPITEVAVSSGYHSHEAFTRAFRARFGVPPSDYRAREQQPARAGIEYGFRQREERVVLAIRHQGPYEQCERAWDRLLQWAETTGVAKYVFENLGLAYDDPEVTAADHLRYDACLAVPPGLPAQYVLPSDVTVRAIAGGRYATAVHVGSYDDILDTYVALLGHWLPQRDLELVNEPVLEVYLNSPFDTAPADLRTEVCMRIAREGIPS